MCCLFSENPPNQNKFDATPTAIVETIEYVANNDKYITNTVAMRQLLVEEGLSLLAACCSTLYILDIHQINECRLNGFLIYSLQIYMQQVDRRKV